MGQYDRKRKVVTSEDKPTVVSNGCIPGSNSHGDAQSNVNQAQSVANMFNPFGSVSSSSLFTPVNDSNSNIVSTPSIPSATSDPVLVETPTPTIPFVNTAQFGSMQRPTTVTRATILIHPTQRNNPVFDYIRNQRFIIESQLCDYECSLRVGVIFISLRYELDNPDYVRIRLTHHKKAENPIKVLLVLVDVDQPQDQLVKLTNLALLYDHTIICASKATECANYLDKLSALEWDLQTNKNTLKNIMKQATRANGDITVNILKTIRKNNTSAINAALKTFGSFAGIAVADKESLQKVHKIGPALATKIYDIMHTPFHSSKNKDE